MATFHRSTRPGTVTYHGRPYRTRAYHLDPGDFGRRVTVTWDAVTGEFTLRAVEGDGRTDRFTVHATTVGQEPGKAWARLDREAAYLADQVWQEG